MLYTNALYEDNKLDIYSQNGEDGVIRAILEKLNVQRGWVCEFGAWDGKHLSNTFALVQKGFKAVFIEGDPARFEALEHTCRSYPNITALLAYVDHNRQHENSLDNLLTRTGIPQDFVLLSIDIDSYDFQVWQSLETYQPRIVIIEINSSVDPKNTDWIHKRQTHMEGTGFGATLELAKEKNYKLLAHTGNMIFVREEDAHLFAIPQDPYTCFRTNWMH